MHNVLSRSAAARSVLLLMICALAGCGWFSKSDPVESANAFFTLLGKGNASAAYSSASFAFQALQTLRGFESTSKELGLLDMQSINWTRCVVKSGEAKLDGEITKRDGTRVVIAVTLIKESGRWKLYSLRTPAGTEDGTTQNRFSLVGKPAAFNQVFKQSLPAESQIKMLVVETLVKFNAAIQKKNFDDFYKYISFAWQTQITQNRMERAFKGFMDMGLDIAPGQNPGITFDEPPMIDNEGLLAVNGRYAVPPYTVTFRLTYSYELPKWRLYGIDVNCLK